MFAKTHFEIKDNVTCALCKSDISNIHMLDLCWDDAERNFGDPYIRCPICNSKIHNVIEENKDDNL